MESRKKAGNKKISFIGLGCWRFGEPDSSLKTDNPGKSYWGGQDRKDSLKVIDAAVRGGINHFDTAQSYGLGKSEQITGQRLRKIRENCVIATKIMTDRFSCGNIEKKIDLSLKRLNTDYIDILYLHWPSDSETVKKSVNLLEELRQTGKIRHIGVSNFKVEDMKTASAEGKIEFHQTGYSLLWRESEKEIIPFCTENNISVIAYSFFAQGLLTAENLMQIGIKENDRRRNLIFFKDGNEKILAKVRQSLNRISSESGYSIPELLTAWGKSKPWLTAVLVGAKNRKQIEQIADSEKTVINKSIIEKIDHISSEIRFSGTENGNIFSHTPKS